MELTTNVQLEYNATGEFPDKQEAPTISQQKDASLLWTLPIGRFGSGDGDEELKPCQDQMDVTQGHQSGRSTKGKWAWPRILSAKTTQALMRIRERKSAKEKDFL